MLQEKVSLSIFSPEWIEDTDRTMTSTARTSYTLIPNQKYRRSNRHSRQHCDIMDTDPQSLSTLGYFKTLPLEIFQMLLNYLSGENIISPSEISQMLLNYFSGENLVRRVLFPISENYHKSFPFRKIHYYFKCFTF